MAVKIIDFLHTVDIDINNAGGSILSRFELTERIHKSVSVQSVRQQVVVAEAMQHIDMIPMSDRIGKENGYGKQQIRGVFDFFSVVIIDADVACQLVIQKNRRSDQRGDFLGVQRSISRRISLLQLFDIVDDDTVVFLKKRQPVGNQLKIELLQFFQLRRDPGSCPFMCVVHQLVFDFKNISTVRN